MTIQQLVDKFESIIPEELFSPRDKYDTTTEHSTVYVVAQMLVAYASDYRGIEWTDLYKETHHGKKLLYSSMFLSLQNGLRQQDSTY